MASDAAPPYAPSPLLMEGTDLAPNGQVWVCTACLKRARSRWGYDADKKSTVIDDGYDSSCMSHAVLCYAECRDGVYRAVEPS
jgi:hypothetical protein